MKKITQHIISFLKGLLIGGTMMVPGASGGTMAIILGIYDKLVHAVSSFMKNKKENFLFLLIFAAGGALGAFLFANPLLKLIERYPMPTLYFFMGAVLGGVPLLIKQSQVKKFTWKIPVYILIGAAVVVLFALIPTGTFQFNADRGIDTYLYLGLAGFVAAVALVLPGISVSYLLLMMGLYDTTMQAISQLQFSFLIPLGIGLILGVLLTTKVLEKAMTRYPQATYLIILGFVFGSIAEIFPGIPQWPEFLLCIVTLAAGFFIIQLLAWKETKKTAAPLPPDSAEV